MCPGFDEPVSEDHHMTTVTGGPVLTEEAGDLNAEPGVGIHERLHCCGNRKLSWFATNPIR